MIESPATARPGTAIGILGPAEIAAGSFAILPDTANTNLERALHDLPPMARATAIKEVNATAADLLDINLIDMLIAGWCTYHELTSAARRTLAQPGSKELVSLVTHRVTAEQQPSIKVVVNGTPVATVQLRFTVDFDVSALLTEITEGRLVAIHTGRCDITATLAIDDIDVATGQMRLELPGAISVTSGIRLLPAEDYPPGAGHTGAASTMPPVQQAQPAPSPTPAALKRRPVRPGGEWWEATGPAVPPAAAPAAAATPKKASSSKRWWGQ
jgi:hypothetical protein